MGISVGHVVFADESKKKGFLLAAASISCADIGRIRGELSSLLLRRQVRIHFSSENERRRQQILRALVAAGGISTVIYDATRYDSMKAGRIAAVTAMAARAAELGASRIVIESDDSAAETDRKTIRSQLKVASLDETIGVDHLRAREAPLLGVPDVVAWCYSAGGVWRQRAEPLISDVVIL